MEPEYQYKFVDSHTHILDYEQSFLAKILNQSKASHINYIVCNTTKIEEFKPMEEISVKYPNFGIIKSFGIHPYCASTLKNQNDWKQLLQNYIKKSDDHLVGEIGLDFRKEIVENNPKELQTLAFQQQMKIAIKYQRPVTIHCVRAHGQMLKYFKKLSKDKQIHSLPNIIMHSYGGSKQITKSLVKLQNLNIYFSLSLKRSQELCEVIPLERLLFETDSPYQLNKELVCNWDKSFEKYEFKEDKNQIKWVRANEVLHSYYNIILQKFVEQVWKNSLKAFKLLK